MKASFWLRYLVTGWLLAFLVFQALPANAAPLARDPAFSGTLMSPPPRALCPGDQAAISVFILDTVRNLPAAGYPVNILQSNPAVGVLDPISKVVVNGTVNFVYKSNDNGSGKGTQVDVLTFNTGGYPTGLKVPITVNDCGDYQVDFLIEQRKQQDFVELYSYFSGKGTASRINQQLTGTETGFDEVFLSIGGETNGMVCKLEPSIQGQGVFNIDGVINPQGPGSDLLTLGLTFDNIQVNDALIYCAVLNTMASFPLNVGSWDPDDLRLTDLQVPLLDNTGTIPISIEEMSGQLTVRRGAQ